MLFTDSLFLFYFLPGALVALYLTGLTRRATGYPGASKALLFILTLCFYGCQETWWLVPFLICVGFDFVWASLLTRVENRLFRRFVLAASIVQNLGLLGLFKYWDFCRTFLVAWFPAWDSALPRLLLDGRSMLLPAGISFYTFESLSFVIDVYRREIRAPRNPLDFFAFIAMFPRFVAGPIVRYKQIASQYATHSGLQIERGLTYFLYGFCLKSLFADQFAIFANYAFSNDGHLGFLAAWVGVFSYTMQIYFDFSGYSLMAIGLGFCLGFTFPPNFNRPYLATSLQDFWRRWHMTLSLWLRDYVYFSLGGNRKGLARTYINVFLTMVLGGIWHGAGWTFVAWGVWHGMWLAIERALPAISQAHTVSRVRTFFLVMIGWVFFRSSDLAQAGQIIRALFNPLDGLTSFNATGFEAHVLSTALCIVGTFFCFGLEARFSDSDVWSASWWRPVSLGFTSFIAMVLNFSSGAIPFLYFQF